MALGGLFKLRSANRPLVQLSAFFTFRLSKKDTKKDTYPSCQAPAASAVRVNSSTQQLNAHHGYGLRVAQPVDPGAQSASNSASVPGSTSEGEADVTRSVLRLSP